MRLGSTSAMARAIGRRRQDGAGARLAAGMSGALLVQLQRGFAGAAYYRQSPQQCSDDSR
jgi:hypothetical protein